MCLVCWLLSEQATRSGIGKGKNMLKKKDRGRKWEEWKQPGWMPGFPLALTLTTVQADASPLGQMLTFDLTSHASSQVLLQLDRLSGTITILITSLSLASPLLDTHTHGHTQFFLLRNWLSVESNTVQSLTAAAVVKEVVVSCGQGQS